MAKGAVEMAVLDAELRDRGESFGEFLGAVRPAVDCGVSVGIHENVTTSCTPSRATSTTGTAGSS